MTIGRSTTTAVAALALGFGVAGTANAQSSNYKIPVTLSYAQSNSQTWNTVLLISAGVLVVGLITEEHTLTVLGGIGVIVSLIQTNKTAFQSSFFPQGLDLVQKGNFSFGINPFGQVGLNARPTEFKPSPYILATFKF